MKKISTIMMVILLLLSLAACTNSNTTDEEEQTEYENAHTIVLNGDSATIDGVAIEVFDYTWHVDPSTVHDEVNNAPAEYYTGTKPETDAAAYIDHELYYYPLLNEDSFKLVNYDGEQEWAYYYIDGENDEYIFATLPAFLGSSVPTEMMHSEDEAANNKVLHIKEAGTYIFEGNWDGQILIDLGEKDDVFTDENAKVTIVLNGVNINCTVAPALIFEDLYECDNAWEEAKTHPSTIDTEDAGANVIIADESENTITGQNIYRMLKTKYKDEDSTDTIKTQKKLRKIDAPFYSYATMNIDSEKNNTGTLTINSNFEGLDSELHLTIYNGNITINSDDDGINVNEDHVSIVSFLNGNLNINASLGAEGDGVDSNGYVVIDGATININDVVRPDSAIDSEDGITFTSGKVYIDGEEYVASDSFLREISSANQGFGGNWKGNMSTGQGFDINTDIDIKEFKKAVAELDDDATLEDILKLLGIDISNSSMPMPDGRFQPGRMPANGESRPGDGKEAAQSSNT